MGGRFCATRLCAAFGLLLIFAATSQAGTIALAWDASTSADVAGYLVEYGTEPGVYTQVVDAGNQTSITIHGLADGQFYYFSVRAYSAVKVESALSNEVFGSTSNTPPHITNPDLQSSGEGATVNLAIKASDGEGDPLTFSATGLPNGLHIEPFSGVITGTISYSASGTHSVTVTVSDGPTTTTTNFTWVVLAVDRAPIVGSMVDQSNPVGTIVSLPIAATDPDVDPLSFGATGLPPGLSINAYTGTITGTLSSAGSYGITITASDGVLTAGTGFTWIVLAANNPPTLTPPGNQETSTVSAVTLQLLAMDPDGNSLTFSASGLPPGLLLDSSSGLISGHPTLLGTNDVTVSVSDGLASTTETFTWTINAYRPPTITNPGDQHSVEGRLLSLQISTDNPDGRPLAYTASLPFGLSIDDEGLITGTVPSGSGGVLTAVVWVSDGFNQASVSFVWTVSAPSPTPPVFAAEAHYAFDRNTTGPNRADLSLNVSGENTLLIVALHSEFDGDTNWLATCNGVPGTLLVNTNGYVGGSDNQRFESTTGNPAQGPAAIAIRIVFKTPTSWLFPPSF